MPIGVSRLAKHAVIDHGAVHRKAGGGEGGVVTDRNGDAVRDDKALRVIENGKIPGDDDIFLDGQRAGADIVDICPVVIAALAKILQLVKGAEGEVSLIAAVFGCHSPEIVAFSDDAAALVKAGQDLKRRLDIKGLADPDAAAGIRGEGSLGKVYRAGRYRKYAVAIQIAAHRHAAGNIYCSVRIDRQRAQGIQAAGIFDHTVPNLQGTIHGQRGV